MEHELHGSSIQTGMHLQASKAAGSTASMSQQDNRASSHAASTTESLQQVASTPSPSPSSSLAAQAATSTPTSSSPLPTASPTNAESADGFVGDRCGPLDHGRLFPLAVRNTLIISSIDLLTWNHYGPSFVSNIKAAGIPYWLVVALDEETAAAMEKIGEGRHCARADTDALGIKLKDMKDFLTLGEVPCLVCFCVTCQCGQLQACVYEHLADNA